jgi:hypothetical protein
MRPRGSGHACVRGERYGATYNHVGGMRCVRGFWWFGDLGVFRAGIGGRFGGMRGVWADVGYEAAV